MDNAEITERTERMATKGVDMRTILLDFEDRMKRPMSAHEHQAFVTGWKAAEGARHERHRQRALDVAREAFPVRQGDGA